MNPAKHIKRFPNARPSTISYLMRRDEKVEQLRRELGMPKRKSFWQRIAFWRR